MQRDVEAGGVTGRWSGLKNSEVISFVLTKACTTEVIVLNTRQV